MMLNNINLNLLRALSVLLDECHVSRAAERLHITQSAVSRQLAQLRTLFDDPLLVRDGNQLVPTPRALVIKKRLDRMFSEVDNLLADAPFQPHNWRQEFVFSSSDYVAQYIVPSVVSVLTDQAPNLNLTYKLWDPDYLDQLHTNGIDLASTMLPRQPEYVSSVLIGEDKSVLLMRQGHPLADKGAVSMEDMLAHPHLKVTGGGDKDTSTDVVLNALGHTRRVALKVPFFTAAVNALQSSHYLMVVPEHIAINLSRDASLLYRPLPFDTASHLYWLIWHPKYDLDPAHQWMREVVLSAMRTSPYSIGMI